MPLRTNQLSGVLLAGLLLTGGAHAAPVYLNIDNIDVMVGDGTSPGSFNNTFNGGQTIDKVIDAPSAISEEFHNQSTHIWFTADELGGGLELEFDFRTEYDITTLHFWNYTAEGFDVDNLSFTFFNNARVEVGSLDVIPDLGSSPGILAQDYLLAAPLNVQYVTVFLSGDNRQVDFQNIGFTAELSTAEPPDPTDPPDPVDPPTSTVPEPGSLGLLMMAGLLVSYRRFRTG